MAEKMVFAYLRVSSRGQELGRQRQILTDYAASKSINVSRIFEEKQSGKNFEERPVYQAMKLTLRRDDILIIVELDRLGRNMAQIKDEWRELEQAGVELIVIENELLNTAGKTDLERTLISNIVFELLSYLAEKERLKIAERQKVGIRLAQEAGKYKGRGRIPIDETEFERVYTSWQNGEIKAVDAMKALSLTKDTWYRRVREREQQPQPQLK